MNTQNIGKVGLRTSVPIDLSTCDMPSGTYLVQIQSGSNLWTKKLIIY
jgi:hypothetical protein